jgi:hypothetical protein
MSTCRTVSSPWSSTSAWPRPSALEDTAFQCLLDYSALTHNYRPQHDLGSREDLDG